jgi:hypothetical protein
MSSFKKGLAALSVFFLVALAPVASVASSTHFDLVTAAHADEAPAPAVSTSPAPAIGVADQIGSVGDKIGGIADKIPLDGVPITVLIMVVGFVYDMVRRKWPTKNPASLWLDVKKIIDATAKVLSGIGKLLGKLGDLGDKVFGQNLK